MKTRFAVFKIRKKDGKKTKAGDWAKRETAEKHLERYQKWGDMWNSRPETACEYVLEEIQVP